MAKKMRAHIVGMSNALQAAAARQAGIEVLGLSLITNLAAGISPHPLSHQEVIDARKSAERVVSKLMTDIVHMLRPRRKRALSKSRPGALRILKTRIARFSSVFFRGVQPATPKYLKPLKTCLGRGCPLGQREFSVRREQAPME
jgi:hypothetical protein